MEYIPEEPMFQGHNDPNPPLSPHMDDFSPGPAQFMSSSLSGERHHHVVQNVKPLYGGFNGLTVWNVDYKVGRLHGCDGIE